MEKSQNPNVAESGNAYKKVESVGKGTSYEKVDKGFDSLFSERDSDEIQYLVSSISRFEAKNQKAEKLVGDIALQLKHLKSRIAHFREKYPKNKKLEYYSMALEDLEKDFLDAKNDNVIDSSLEKIGDEISEQIAKSGIEFIPATAEMTGYIQEKLPGYTDILSNGVVPEYVTLSPEKTENTLILFSMSHRNPLTGELSKSAEKSGKQIRKNLDALVQQNVITEMYIEGFSYQRNDDGSAFERVTKSDHPSAKYFTERYGTKGVVRKGFEDALLGPHRGLRLFSEDASSSSLMQRAMFENVFMAMNLKAQLLRSGKNIQAFSLGAVHESFEILNRVTGDNIVHPLPISKVLASMGVNVVVVDTSHIEDFDIQRK